MLGLAVIIVALIPTAVGVWLGFAAETQADQWKLMGVGIVGTLCVLLLAYVSHCVEKEDRVPELYG